MITTTTPFSTFLQVRILVIPQRHSFIYILLTKSKLLESGLNISLGNVVYEPPRDGFTLWEIGVPDRTAAEFYIPDPNPNFVNKLYLNRSDHKYRQYGLWERYAELYPDEDMVYNVDVDDYSKNWFFMQVTRLVCF